jgi:exopolyphosphatase/pppGpp-phosphohydrolase
MAIEQLKKISQDNVHHLLGVSPTKALVIGIGTVVLAPTLASLLKPVAKATLKTGVVVYEKTKSTLAETGEVVADIVAEAKAEVAAEQAKQVAATNTVDVTPQQPSHEG